MEPKNKYFPYKEMKMQTHFLQKNNTSAIPPKTNITIHNIISAISITEEIKKKKKFVGMNGNLVTPL